MNSSAFRAMVTKLAGRVAAATKVRDRKEAPRVAPEGVRKTLDQDMPEWVKNPPPVRDGGVSQLQMNLWVLECDLQDALRVQDFLSAGMIRREVRWVRQALYRLTGDARWVR